LRETSGIPLLTAEWTDNLGDTTDAFLFVIIGPTGDGVADGIDPPAYRCVTGPTIS
jgi:hypothetical protein